MNVVVWVLSMVPWANLCVGPEGVERAREHRERRLTPFDKGRPRDESVLFAGVRVCGSERRVPYDVELLSEADWSCLIQFSVFDG